MRDPKGQALIELSVSIVLLFMIVFGIIEFGRYFFYLNTANNAAREGVRWAVTHAAASGWCTEVKNHVVSTYGSQLVLTTGDITVTPCPSAQPANGSSVQVQVVKPFTILTGSIIPYFSGSKSITGDATMRYEL